MALEQLIAFLEDRKQEELGPVTRIEPDQFPLLASSDLGAEHEAISELFKVYSPERGGGYSDRKLAKMAKRLDGDQAHRTRTVQALVERRFAFETGLSPNDYTTSFYQFFGYGPSDQLIALLMQDGVDPSILEPLLRWSATHRNHHYSSVLIEPLFQAVQATWPTQDFPPLVRTALQDLLSHFTDGDADRFLDNVQNLDGLLGDGLWQVLAPIETWAEQAIADLESMPEDPREAWTALLKHCQTAKSAKPSGKWIKGSEPLLEAVGREAFKERFIAWVALVDRGRTRPHICSGWEEVDDRQRMHDLNGNILRGLTWLCPRIGDADCCRAIAQLGISAYRKVRGLGPRAVKVGNAAVYALGEIGSEAAVGQLAILKVRVKFGTAQKGIEKALTATAERAGIPREELEEMSVPSYGLTEVGGLEEAMGDFTARLRITGTTSTELAWLKPDGKAQKSVPASVKKDFAEELKELKTAAKDIQKMVPAQRDRIDNLFLEQKAWAFNTWKERYLDHPLVGTLARRIIWTFDGSPGIFLDGRLVDAADGELHPGENAEVALWHPIGYAIDDILEWRNWLERHQVAQPFKQAHREVYLLTDAERNTGLYSNRFAAHILKQHQFNALCGIRTWKNALRLMVDDSFPPASRALPTWNLRAEFWVEGAGDDYGVDTNETGTYLYLSTDQVRFYPLESEEHHGHAYGGGYDAQGEDPTRLEAIPPLVFSEIMRDVDLFVGVASLGNDPNWSDGGPEGRYRDYWNSYSFGELGASAKTRKQVLETLIPKLKIADRCSFEDKFLVVQGDIRSYKIHLGSGNILMNPNDQYLCIVAKSSARKSDQVFLPFEGDTMMAIILSKALMLAEDKKIKDPTILSQIQG